MPYTAQFFAEKLNVPVDYFNPFRNIEIDPSLDLEELSNIFFDCRTSWACLSHRPFAPLI